MGVETEPTDLGKPAAGFWETLPPQFQADFLATCGKHPGTFSPAWGLPSRSDLDALSNLCEALHEAVGG